MTLSFGDWLTLSNLMIFDSTHFCISVMIFLHDRMTFHNTCVPHIFFIHPWVGRHPRWLRILAVVAIQRVQQQTQMSTSLVLC